MNELLQTTRAISEALHSSYNKMQDINTLIVEEKIPNVLDSEFVGVSIFLKSKLKISFYNKDVPVNMLCE